MKITRLWALVIGCVLAAFLFIACGGGSKATEVSPTQFPAATPTPVPAATPTPVAQAIGEAPAVSGTGYTWVIDTVDDNAAKPSLAVDSNGVPHIAYLLEAMPGFIKHAVLDDTGWDITTVSTGYLYGPLDIQLSEQDVPHISWHSHDQEDAAYGVLVDGQWQVQFIKHPGHDGWDNNLAIDSAGRPHITSIDPVQFGGQSGVEYATFDGNSWTVEEVGSGPVPYEFGTFIALDSQERPHVVWYDNGDRDLKYALKDAGSWQISTVDSQGDVGRFPSLALDSQDKPVISYFESTGDSTGYVKVARWDGSQWDIQRVDKLEAVALGHFGARKTSSLVLDAADNPIVAYSDETVVKLALWDGSSWMIDTVLTADSDPLGQQVSMALDGDGILHLTFADVARKGGPGVVGSIKYARGTRSATASSDTPSSGEEAGLPAKVISVDTFLIDPDPNFEEAVKEARFSTRGWKTDFSRHTVPYTEIISGGPGKDGIPPLDNPKFTTSENANEWLDELEPVIAFEINGDARAYPLQILTWHEVVNDVVGGEPIIATFCPLCNSAIVFERTLDGVVHDFGVSGNLRKSDLIMWDRQTESWWQQLTGEAIVGTLAGKQLTFLPAPIISWADFKAAHPNGRVLSQDTGFSRPYGRNPYVGYDRVDNPPFLLRRDDLDGRLLPKERVAALTIGDVAAAFPFSVLDQERVVNYTVNGTELTVFFKPGTRSALGDLLIGDAAEIGATGIFEAVLDGRKLTFRSEGDGFIDNETESTWSILGQATAGPLTGSALTPIVHGNHFWFAWGAFQPETMIYQGTG